MICELFRSSCFSSDYLEDGGAVTLGINKSCASVLEEYRSWPRPTAVTKTKWLRLTEDQPNMAFLLNNFVSSWSTEVVKVSIS